ncbi:hypothetical protein ACI2TB_05180 [Ralstonia nicotianae]
MTVQTTIDDFSATYDPGSKTFTVSVPQALLIHQAGAPGENRTDASIQSSHQAAAPLTIRFSPNATWLLGQVLLHMQLNGRQFGEEPVQPMGERH